MNPNDQLPETEQELADKLMDIKDLREAIKIMRNSMLMKSDNPFLGLQYVDTKKHGGNLHHILKGDDCAYHVIKNNQRQADPYSISVRKDGKEVQRSPNHYHDISAVTRALMSYHKNKKWGADDIVKTIFDAIDLKKAKIDSTFEPESRNQLRAIRNTNKDLTGTNEGYSPKGVNKPVAQMRRAHEVVKFAKQPKPNLPKTEMIKEEKGVHQADYSTQYIKNGKTQHGISTAGIKTREGNNPNSFDQYDKSPKVAKELHANKLSELKAMPKPNLPKTEMIKEEKGDMGHDESIGHARDAIKHVQAAKQHWNSSHNSLNPFNSHENKARQYDSAAQSSWSNAFHSLPQASKDAAIKEYGYKKTPAGIGASFFVNKFPHLFNQDEKKSEELDKGSKNVREQKKKIFGTDANAPRLSDKRAKMMGAIKQFAEKQYKLPLQIASGKRDESGELRTDKENQPAFDIFTPKGREAEKQLLAQQKVSGVKRVDAKPDWRSGKLETQPSPDAAIHELAHLNIAPEKMDIATFQEHMDDKWGESQSKHGHMQQKKTHGEIQPMAVENSLRRQMGLPANRATKPVTENQRALDYEGDRFVQGKDAKGKTAFYDRQTRLQTPETKDRLEQIKQGTVKFNPKRGWEPANDTNALINLRGQGKHKEAADRLRSRMAMAKPAAKAEGIIGVTPFKTDDKDLPQHQAATNAKKYAEIKVDEVKKNIPAAPKVTHVAGVPIPKELHAHVNSGQHVPTDHPHRELAAKFVGDVWKQNKLEGKRMSGKLLNVHAPELQAPSTAAAKSEDDVKMSKEDFVKEHKDLVEVLNSPSHEDDKKEAKEQKEELEEVVEKAMPESNFSRIFSHLKQKGSSLQLMEKASKAPKALKALDHTDKKNHPEIKRRMAVMVAAIKPVTREHHDFINRASLMSHPSESHMVDQADWLVNPHKSEGIAKSNWDDTLKENANPTVRVGRAVKDGKMVGHEYEHSLAGAKVRTGDNAGAKAVHKDKVAQLRNEPKPNLPKSEECSMEMSPAMKLKKYFATKKVDENTGLPGTVLDKAKDSGIKGVHTPHFMAGAKTGVSDVGARTVSGIKPSGQTKEYIKQGHASKLKELKAMPKPNLPKSEAVEKASVHEKGVHQPSKVAQEVGLGDGKSTAGMMVSHAKVNRTDSAKMSNIDNAKFQHRTRLKELINMSKPNLPKSEKDDTMTVMDKDKMVHVSNDPKVLKKK